LIIYETITPTTKNAINKIIFSIKIETYKI
jgi:hypothetical protein